MLKKVVLSFMLFIITAFMPVFAAKDNPNKSIVIYYSLNGNTQMMAEKIQSFTGSDLYKIETAKPYSDNYKKFSEKILNEVTYKKCPKLKQKKLNDLYQYDTIFLGIPVYYGDIAPAMRTFLKANKLKGKTVVPFFSLDNGALGNAWKTAKKLSGKTHFKNGFEYRIKDNSSIDAEILDWLYSIK